MRRFKNFHSTGNLFECSFFQNIIEELMLFGMYKDEQIVDFYKELISHIDMSVFKMLTYSNDSPYGKVHNFSGFENLISHFMRRIALEQEVMKILPCGSCLDIESKHYCITDIVEQFGN